MARTLKSDKVLFWEAVALICASLVMLYSASAVVASNRDGSPYGIFFHQLPWAMLGLVALFVMMHVDYHVLRKPEVIWPIVAFTVIALFAVFAFPARKGATRWISIFGLVHFQPSELAKLVAVVFSAAVLERRMHRMDDVKWALGPVVLVAGGMVALIVLQKDLGTPAVLVLAVIAMAVSAGLAWRHLVGVTLVMLPALAGLVIMYSYRMKRLLAFMDPTADPTGIGYQLNQSKIALGVGGVLGVGLGHGMQKLSFLPEPQNDFIFAVIGEELGLLGTTAMVIAFGVIAWRGLRASLTAPDRFGSLLGVGLTMMIALQAMVNMTVVTGMAPTKGLPLPLVSAGGTSLLMNLIAMGILLNISQQASSTAHSTLDS